MKKKILSLGIALCLAGMSLNAQVSFGPKVGLNLANLSGDAEELLGESPSMKIGAQIGGVVNMNFTDALALQPGLILSMKGASVSMEMMGISMDMTYSANYLEVPINMVYGIDMGAGQLQVFAGPYLSYGLFGKVSTSAAGVSDDTDIQFVSDAVDADDDKAAINALDYGINAGLGFKTGAIQIQAGYGLGLGNIEPKYDGEDPEYTTTNSVIQLNVAYLLGN
jgi:hypothetical protein